MGIEPVQNYAIKCDGCREQINQQFSNLTKVYWEIKYRGWSVDKEYNICLCPKCEKQRTEENLSFLDKKVQKKTEELTSMIDKIVLGDLWQI